MSAALRSDSVEATVLALLAKRHGQSAAAFRAQLAEVAGVTGLSPSSVHNALRGLLANGHLVRAGRDGVAVLYAWPGAEAAKANVVAFKGGVRETSARHDVTRFKAPKPAPEQVVPLRADHPALAQERTIFPTTVKTPCESERLFVSGHNNPKLGAVVTKGRFAGRPIYHLTLEERATCPRSCLQWATCYGNGMHMARRHDHRDPNFLAFVEAELWGLWRAHPDGFMVRLHTLGDFYSVEYVDFWRNALAHVGGLAVFGFSACLPDAADPAEREIGQAVAALAEAEWTRFAIRFSRAEPQAQSSVVVLEPLVRDDVVMCPAQTEATTACATCGFCWSIAGRAKTVGFLLHGPKRGAPQ